MKIESDLTRALQELEKKMKIYNLDLIFSPFKIRHTFFQLLVKLKRNVSFVFQRDNVLRRTIASGAGIDIHDEFRRVGQREAGRHRCYNIAATKTQW